MRQMEQEVMLLRQELHELVRAKKSSDERVVQLTNELTATRATANQVLQRLLQANGNGMAAYTAQLGMAAQAASNPSMLGKVCVSACRTWTVQCLHPTFKCSAAVCLPSAVAGCMLWGRVSCMLANYHMPGCTSTS